MGKNPSNFNGNDNCPVESVSWHDTQEFITKLNQKDDKIYRLPTEAEWEYACRAGTSTIYYTGNSVDDLDRAGWYSGNSGNKTHPVGEKETNAWGLYDMHGNVWEWCQDWYGDYPSGSVTDPIGLPKGSFRVIRGGSWYSAAQSCRSASRPDFEPGIRLLILGFRLVLLPGQP